MNVGQPERETQRRVITLFRQELGYDYLGDWSDRNGNSNIDEGLLTAYLHKAGYSTTQISRAMHGLQTERYLLKLVEHDAAPQVELKHSKLILSMRAGASKESKDAVLSLWYREQIKAAVPDLLATWEPRLGVKADRFFVRRMKTKWGSCNHEARSIRINTELAKKPPECLEYIVVHELVHLLEPTHNDRFIGLMDRFLPNWKVMRQVLNRLPVRHEQWGY